MESIWNSTWHFILGWTIRSDCFCRLNMDMWFSLVSDRYVLATVILVSFLRVYIRMYTVFRV